MDTCTDRLKPAHLTVCGSFSGFGVLPIHYPHENGCDNGYNPRFMTSFYAMASGLSIALREPQFARKPRDLSLDLVQQPSGTARQGRLAPPLQSSITRCWEGGDDASGGAVNFHTSHTSKKTHSVYRRLAEPLVNLAGSFLKSRSNGGNAPRGTRWEPCRRAWG